MTTEPKNTVSEKFIEAARNSYKEHTNPWFVGAACVFAGVAAPFNPQTALFILSVPTVYQGIAIGCRVVGELLKKNDVPPQLKV
jgi:hypothetical protein